MVGLGLSCRGKSLGFLLRGVERIRSLSRTVSVSLSLVVDISLVLVHESMSSFLPFTAQTTNGTGFILTCSNVQFVNHSLKTL